MPSRRLHPSARTTRKQRRQIQRSPESDRALARKHRLNPKTIAKWRRRDGVDDAPMGPKTARLSALSPIEEALVVAVRQLTWASLDILLPRLQTSLPYINRTSLYLAWKKWGVSRTPRTLPRPDFPFARHPDAEAPDVEDFQLRVVRLHVEDDAEAEKDGPDDAPRILNGEGMIFVVGERSGKIISQSYTEFVVRDAVGFLTKVISILKQDNPPTRIRRLTTPCHWLLCNEEAPGGPGHWFSLSCRKEGIERRVVSDTPEPIPLLQKGWPGEAPPPKPKRRRKTAALQTVSHD